MMSRKIPQFSIFVILVLAVGLLPGHFQAHAASKNSAIRKTQAKVPTDVLLWQGKVLPIVIAVYSSFNNLNTALQAHDVQGLTDTANEFALEQQQFATVQPTPAATHVTAGELGTGLRDLAGGTKALVAGLQANDNAAAQRAANTIVKGLQLFQTAVDQIRKASGGALATAGSSSATPGPQPTPIIPNLG